VVIAHFGLYTNCLLKIVSDNSVHNTLLAVILKIHYMKDTSIILFLIILFTNCNGKKNSDLEYVYKKFREYSDKIEKVEYNIQKIDTFSDGESPWNNKGFAFIERDRSDKIFGYSFYGKRNDISKEYIYDKGFAFIIDDENRKYNIDKGDFRFLGKPGGQMVLPHIFYLDSIYKSVELIKDEKYYVLKFQFENDTVYNVTDVSKIIKLKKDNFFPVEIISTYKMLGNKSVTQLILSDIKINEQTKASIQDYKSKLKNLEIIQPEKGSKNTLLRTKFPSIILPDILNETDTTYLKTNKLTLIDFWEVWCGYCIASFPKIEEIKNKYRESLQVIGIVTQDKENAISLIKSKTITFTNLFGNRDLLNIFGVNSFPRYFLIDNNGIVQKEYFGFSDQIEKDIKEMITK
jgi:thiol-disulfide isomerase/thioredoxin